MSKNMTRKGLAFGAGASLLAASLVGLPAQAANAELISLSPSAGSGFSTLAGSTFTLATSIDSSIAVDTYTQLRYRIQNGDQEDVTVEMKSDGTGGLNTLMDYGDATTVASNRVGDLTFGRVIGLTDAGKADLTVANNVATLTFADADTAGDDDLLSAGQSITLSNVLVNTDNAATVDNSTGVVTGAITEAALATALTGTFELASVSTDNTITTATFALTIGDVAAGDIVEATTGEKFSFTLTSGNSDSETTNDEDFVVEPVAATDGEAGKQSTLELSVGSLSTTTALTVTAFLDLDGNNEITDGEVISAPTTVTFVPASLAVGSVSLQSPAIGSATLYANVSFAGDINVRQIDTGDVKVQFTGDKAEADVNATFVSAAVGYAAASTHTVAGGESFTVALTLDQNDNGTTSVANDSVAEDTDTKVAGAVEADVFTVTLTTGVGISVTTVAKEENNTTPAAELFVETAGTATVREEIATVTVKGFVGTNVVKPLAVKNKPVVLTVTPSGITASDKFTVDGKQYSLNQATTINTTTDKDGNWSIDLGTAGLDATDTVKVQVASVDGVAGFSGTDGIMTITVAESNYTLLDTTDSTGENLRTIKAGDTVTMNYKMVDQWGQAPKNGAYRVAISDLSNNRATKAADFAVSASVVDGLVSLTFTDNGTGIGYTDVRAQFGPTAGALSTTAGDFITTRVFVVADSAVATITLDALAYGTAQYVKDTTTDNRKKLLLEDKALGAFDANQAVPGAEAPEIDATFVVTVAGTVANAAKAGLDGSVVTVSGAGLQFQVGSVYAVGTATFVADGDGDFSVGVWSQIGGTRTVTITSGGVSQTVALPYAGAAAGSEDSLTVASVASITPGSTTNVVATVKDDLGNGVKGITVMFSTTIGYMAQAEVTTDANGVAVGKLVTSVADKGNTSLTVSIPGNDDVAAVSQTVGVGQSADQKVNAGSFKGYVALYAKGYEGQRMSAKVGNDWVIVPAIPAATNGLFRAVEFVGAGVEISVRLYIDRVLVATIPLLTK